MRNTHTDYTAVERLISTMSQKLRTHKQMLAIAESCTGGWLSKLCSDLPGSSEWFAGGIVAYSNEVKTALLDIPAALLESKGAVSEAVVVAMCTGTLKHIPNADIAIAVSGNAGPTTEPGGAVGEVWFATQARQTRQAGNDLVHTHCAHYDGSRTEVRARAVIGALELLIETW